MKSKKKLLTSVVALGTAAALTLGGTFAWQSISQTAVNEASDIVNPGGRLHNDQNWVSDKENDTNIYVENFTDPEKGGNDIYARVRLSEYMEVVMNYGVKGAEVVDVVAGSKTVKTDEDGNAVTDDDGNTLTNDSATQQGKFDYEYAIHYFGDDAENKTDDFFEWTTGETTDDSETVYYMPTFNKNKDSLLADLNGTYKDTLGGISNRGENQYTYTEVKKDTTATGYEVWDGDSDSNDDVKNRDDLNDLIKNGEGAANYGTLKDHIKLVDAAGDNAHKAAAVGTTRGLIALSDWLKLTDDTDNYWVYDDSKDDDGNATGGGWVYWSSPIKAGTTTGLLLDGFTLTQVMDDTWYYAIDVEAQFVTANDVGKDNNTGFYADGETVTENAEELLKNIGVEFGEETGPRPILSAWRTEVF